MQAIYLDNAATSYPKPPQVTEAVARCLREVGGNPGRSGHAFALAAGRAVEDCREALAALLGAQDPARIGFTANCTGALNTAIQGFVRPGDHVITTAMEHNSTLRPLVTLQRRGIIELTILPLKDGVASPADLLAALRPNTRLACFCHVSNVTGAVAPVELLGELCRIAGVTVLLDAAQSAGHLPIDVSTLPVDMVALPGHKGLMGPQGTGALYVSPALELRPLMQGGTGSYSDLLTQPEAYPDHLESGTLNTPGLSGLAAGIAWRRGEFARIHAAEQQVLGLLVRGLARIPGVWLLGETAMPRCGVVAFNIRRHPSGDVADLLSERYGIAVRGGLHCAPLVHRHYGTLEQGAVRVSPGPMTTVAEAEAALEAVETLARELRG